MLPAPVLSRNAALQVWGQIATLYDDPPSVEVAGMDATPLKFSFKKLGFPQVPLTVMVV